MRLPRGRWRVLMGGALIVTTFLSLHALPLVVQMLNDFGAVIPLRVRLAGSSWWLPACVAVAVLGIGTAAMTRRRARLSAAVLTVTTLLVIGAASISVSSLFHSVCVLGDFGDLPRPR